MQHHYCSLSSRRRHAAGELALAEESDFQQRPEPSCCFEYDRKIIASAVLALHERFKKTELDDFRSALFLRCENDQSL